MPQLEVQPRPTPEERADVPVSIDVDEDLAVHAATLDDWAAPRVGWECSLEEGHDFGRPNNVVAHLLFASGEQTVELRFRLDQIDNLDDTGEELVIVLEERDGIAKLARLRSNGLDVELFHILTYT
jgi:hypothetical protein